jgi:hypothetical protein
MHVPINVESPNNISKWQMGINSAFKGLMKLCMISGFHRKVDENCTLMFYYTATSGNSLRRSQDNLSVSSSRVTVDP